MAITLDTFRSVVNSSSVQNSDNISVSDVRFGTHQLSVVDGKGYALDTRQALLAALNQKYGNNIPKSVLKAMNVSKAFSGFSVGKDGEVKVTNHPLSARRIRTILKAVDSEDHAMTARLSGAVRKFCDDCGGIVKEKRILLASYCWQIRDQLGTENGRAKLEKYCMVVLGKAMPGEQIKSLAKSLAERARASADDFTVIDMPEQGKLEVEDRRAAAVLKGFDAFQRQTGMEISPRERRIASSFATNYGNPEMKHIDLSKPDNAKALSARLAELRNGDCHEAGESTLRLMSAIMYADPKVTPETVRHVLKAANVCKRNGIEMIASQQGTTLGRLKDVFQHAASAIAEEFSQMNVDTHTCDETNRVFDLLMYAISSEMPAVGDLIKSLTLEDIATISAEANVAESKRGVVLTPVQKRIAEIVAPEHFSGTGTEDGILQQTNKKLDALNEDQLNELHELQLQEIEAYVPGRLLYSAAMTEAVNHVDKPEMEVLRDQKIDEMLANAN